MFISYFLFIYTEVGDINWRTDTRVHPVECATSGEAYRDRRLTTNFELWVAIFWKKKKKKKNSTQLQLKNFSFEIFWVWNFLCADMFPCEDSKTVSVCLSICPHPEKRNHHSFVNISPTLVIDTSMERSSRVLQHGNPKIWTFLKIFYFNFLEEEWYLSNFGQILYFFN